MMRNIEMMFALAMHRMQINPEVKGIFYGLGLRSTMAPRDSPRKFEHSHRICRTSVIYFFQNIITHF